MDKKNEANNSNKKWSMVGLALNLGYMIALPILFFGIGGVLLDKYLKLFPVFTLIGFLFAMSTGLLVVYFKTKDVLLDPSLIKKKQKDNK